MWPPTLWGSGLDGLLCRDTDSVGSELILRPLTALALCLSPVGWGLCLAVGLVGSWVSFSYCWSLSAYVGL